MNRRPQKFAATALVSTLALATAAFGAPGDTLTIETQKADVHAAASTADGRRPLAEVERNGRRGVVEIRAQAANVRAGPTADAPVITTMTRGCLLPMVERSGNWVRVGLGFDHAGWVHSTLVAATAAPEVDGTAHRKMVEIQARAANVRAGPATNAPVIKVLTGGCLLPALERSDHWVRIGLDGGQAGWVHRTLVVPTGAREAQVEITSAWQEARRVSTSALRTTEPPRAKTSGPGTLAVAPEVRPVESTATAPKSEPLRPSLVEPAPVPPRERSGAQIETSVTTTIGLRELPTRSAPVAGRLERGGEATDLGRRADRRIEVTAERPDGGQSSGHQLRTQSVTGAMTTSPAAAPSAQTMLGGAVKARAEEAITDAEKLHRFKTRVKYVNERVRRAVGIDVFAKIEHLGGGVIELTATQAWVAAPELARRANLKTLSRFWASMHEPGAPVVVRIVDDHGEVMMERRGGAEPTTFVSAGG